MSDSEDISSDHGKKGSGSDNDDEEFEFGNYAKKQQEAKTQEVSNKPYDAAVDLTNDSDDGGSQATPEDTPRSGDEMRESPKKAATATSSAAMSGSSMSSTMTKQNTQSAASRAQNSSAQDKKDTKKNEDNKSDESTSDEDDEDASQPAAPAPAAGLGPSPHSGEQQMKKQTKLFNMDDWAHLKVSSEIQGLFDHIGRHKPHNIELETKLRPFFPDFIPAVGEIDAFLKIPPPDGKNDGLGLKVLDEPALDQSDPTVLDMKIRRDTRKAGLEPIVVRGIEHADKNPQKITTWINNVEGVHRGNPPPTVTYIKPMPDIESLMQVWPSEFEEILKNTPLPSADLKLDISQYSKIICALLDIPTHDKVIDSLHLLFTLFSEFKSNAHFSQT